MRMVDLIQKKKHGEVLTKDEIDFVIQGYVREEIPDYQMSAFLMAVYFKGMSKEEITNMTLSFVNSGDTVDLSKIHGIKVDKHSTGGVGDKISLIAVPLVASVGVPVVKMSGRGLGHTGGTIDKLESIKGFDTEISIEKIISNVNKYSMAIVKQTQNLTPADKKIYALRDVTATVDSIPLIASSIMSKKIASGADRIVLDVKVGSGAFMKTPDEARALARTMVDIGNLINRKTIAIITDMNQPLGREVGNANEVREAIEVLKGNGAEDVTVIALTIASYMAVLGEAFNNYETAYDELNKIIKSGKAIEKLKELVMVQGGNPYLIDNPEELPKADHHIEVKVYQKGYVKEINAENIGVSAILLGAGRRKKDDEIDPAAGITITKKVGDEVKPNDTICVLHTNLKDFKEAEIMARNAFIISDTKLEHVKYIYETIE